MESNNPALMSTPKTEEDWLAVQGHFTNLYWKNPLREVRRLMQRELNFTASERQYKHRIGLWGLRKYKKGHKKQQLETGYTTTSDNPSSAVSSDGETSHQITSAGSSISPAVNHTGHARVLKMSKLRRRRKADAKDSAAVRNELVSTRTTTSSNPEPIQSPTPPIQSVRPNYRGGDFFDESASLPEMAVLPVFPAPYNELETMGITMAAQDGSSQAEPASERPDETDIGQSFGSSSKSSGTIDSNNPKSVYDILEDEYMRELY